MLGERLKKCRIRLGLTQIQVANAISDMVQGNMDFNRYGSYERDNREPPNDVLVALADVMQVSTDYLLGKTDVPSYTPNLLDEELERVIAAIPRVRNWSPDLKERFVKTVKTVFPELFQEK